MEYKTDMCEKAKAEIASFSDDRLMHNFGHYLDEIRKRFPELMAKAEEVAKVIEKDTHDPH